jgi:hypothetical protein
VKRGLNWKWNDQDGGVGSYGVVQGPTDGAIGWCNVVWEDSVSTLSYRVGAENSFDLCHVVRQCRPCAAGTHGIMYGGLASCRNCPPGSSTSTTGSANINDCTCLPGFTGPDGGMCVQCAPGKYKESPGTVTCNSCPENQDTLSSASESGAACLCKPGFTGAGGNGGSCQACASGTYKDTVGSAPCMSCPSVSNSLSGSVNAEDCLCNAGYTGLQTCVACETGKYKETIGSQDCLPCPALSNTVNSGSASLEECVCDVGLILNGRVCQQCPVGQYYNAVTTSCTTCSPCEAGYRRGCELNSPGTCEVCPAGKYLSQSACYECPANSFSSAGSTGASQCKCNPGFTGQDGGPCQQCHTGKYKAASGSGGCNQCPEHSTTLFGNTAVSDCLCLPGYAFGDEKPCSACMTGKYKNETGQMVRIAFFFHAVVIPVLFLSIFKEGESLRNRIIVIAS